jgi:antitoxin component of MazEF toxin-antitoxin module
MPPYIALTDAEFIAKVYKASPSSLALIIPKQWVKYLKIRKNSSVRVNISLIKEMKEGET